MKHASPTDDDVIAAFDDLERRLADDDAPEDEEPESYDEPGYVPRVLLAGVAGFGAIVAALVLMASCTPEQRAAAAPIVSAVGAVGCKLAPLAAPGDTGAIVGVVCEDLVQVAAGILTATGKPRSAEPCRELVPIEVSGQIVGAACPAYAGALAKGLAK